MPRTQSSRFSFHGSMLVAAVSLLGCASATTVSDDDGTLAAGESVAGGNNADASTWCEVSRLLARTCQRCHSDPPQHGAPFALASYADTQTLDKRGQPRYAVIAQVVGRDEMPPNFIKLDPPVDALTADEKQLLLDWCAASAPGGDSCAEE